MQVGVDISEAAILGSTTPQSPKETDFTQKTLDKYSSLAILDRDLKNIKFRYQEFPGVRVPATTLALSSNLSNTQQTGKTG